jgi:hypothetical protein
MTKKHSKLKWGRDTIFHLISDSKVGMEIIGNLNFSKIIDFFSALKRASWSGNQRSTYLVEQSLRK